VRLTRQEVGLAERSYSVVLAPHFGGLGAELRKVQAEERCVVVSNPTVRALYGAAVRAELEGEGWKVDELEIPDGEAHKNLQSWGVLVEALLGLGVDRKTPVVALGGGVTGDLVGFAASTVMRGLPFVQVPTTLLAMVDASVGGKTGVNTEGGKNLVGSFYQPVLVWAALNTLQTLQEVDLRSGLGEVLKHALIDGEVALSGCERMAPALLRRDPAALASVIEESVRTKARLVEADEREDGPRAVLNLGHTLGHAIEKVGGYGRMGHGEAVGLGILAVARFGWSRGWLKDRALPERVHALLGRLGLPQKVPFEVDEEALARAIGFDKKRARGMLNLVVPQAAGEVVLRKLSMEEVPALVDALKRLG
jgi:3-dehydroquinate synthase